MALALAPFISMQASTTPAGQLKITVCTMFPVRIMQARRIIPRIMPDHNLDVDLLSLRRTASQVQATRSLSASISADYSFEMWGHLHFSGSPFRPSTPTSCPSECLINCNHFSFVYFTCFVRLVCVSFAPARSPSVFVCCCCFIINPRPTERNKFYA